MNRLLIAAALGLALRHAPALAQSSPAPSAPASAAPVSLADLDEATLERRLMLADTVFRHDGTAEAFEGLLAAAAEACEKGTAGLSFKLPDGSCRRFVQSFDMGPTLGRIGEAYVKTYTEAELTDSAGFYDSVPMKALSDGTPAFRKEAESIVRAWEAKGPSAIAAPAAGSPAPKAPEPWVWPVIEATGVPSRDGLRAYLLARAGAAEDAPGAKDALDRTVADVEAAAAATFGTRGPAIFAALTSEDRRRVEERHLKVRPLLEPIAQQLVGELDTHLNDEVTRFKDARDRAVQPAAGQATGGDGK